MIRPLRQRHRAAVCALAVLLPAAFAAGLAARRPVPVAASVPPELATKASAFGKVVWTKADVWPDQRIITSLRRDASGAVAVEFLFRDVIRPDVLVYWAAGKESAGEGLPENARLLGAFLDRTPLPLPADARGETGRFVLYSLANHEVVAVSRPVTLVRFNAPTL
jgi:hypothetical protein